MEILIALLFWVHIMALVAGGSNSVVMPIIGSKMATATPETRQTLFSIGNRLAFYGKIAMGLLLVTGPLMVWLKYDGVGNLSFWFWVKMALVVVMLVSIVIGGRGYKRAQSGDMAGAALAEQAGKVTGVALLGVVLTAALAFA